MPASPTPSRRDASAHALIDSIHKHADPASEQRPAVGGHTAGSPPRSEGTPAGPSAPVVASISPAAPVALTERVATSARYGTRASLRALVAIAVLLCAYLLPGTLGHDPWKQDETYTFGIIEHMLDTGDLVVPTNAGQPFVEKPPLYDWVAAGLARVAGSALPLHDAARLASVLFSLLTLACLGRLAFRTLREHTGFDRAMGPHDWLDLRVLGTLALFAGTPLALKHMHDMMTDVALTGGTALGFCGLYELVAAHERAQAPHGARRTDEAAIMFGIGAGIAFMTKGLFLPLVFGATLSATLLVYPSCRTRTFLRALVLAAAVFAPFALLWPAAFYLRSPELFKVWLWDNNVGRFFGFSVAQLGSENDKPLFIWRALLTAGFPAGPLALVTLAAGAWRRWREPRVALPVIFCGTGIAVLQASATARELYLLPFIAPLAVLAVQGIDRFPQRLSTAWDFLARIVFGLFAALVWLVWSDMTDPASSHAGLAPLGRWLPLDWTIPIRPAAVLPALALTFGWLWLLPRLKRIGKWRGIYSWCAGAMLAWGLVFTLLLPWLDAAKSYRSVFEDLSSQLDTRWHVGDCMSSVALGESEAPMLYYFSGILHRPAPDAASATCRWLLVQGTTADTGTPGGGWTLFWTGARPGDSSESLRVFMRKRVDSDAAAKTGA
jgi:4-amino-4-deoxy-L-arabinose transferase-like glycosyltransferase